MHRVYYVVLEHHFNLVFLELRCLWRSTVKCKVSGMGGVIEKFDEMLCRADAD